MKLDRREEKLTAVARNSGDGVDGGGARAALLVRPPVVLRRCRLLQETRKTMAMTMVVGSELREDGLERSEIDGGGWRSVVEGCDSSRGLWRRRSISGDAGR